MKLLPADIQNKVFKKSKIGGYQVNEVNEFLLRISQEYQLLMNETTALKEQMDKLNESMQYYRAMETTIQNVLVLADKTAQETKEAAFVAAEEVKKDAAESANKMCALAEEQVLRIKEQGVQEVSSYNQKIDDIKRQYGAYRAQLKQYLQGQLNLLEEIDMKPGLAQEYLTLNIVEIKEQSNDSACIEYEEANYEEASDEPLIDEELA